MFTTQVSKLTVQITGWAGSECDLDPEGHAKLDLRLVACGSHGPAG